MADTLRATTLIDIDHNRLSFSVGTGQSRDKFDARGFIVFYILTPYFLIGNSNGGALVENFFSQISTAFVFEDLHLRNLPILHVQNYLRES